MLILQASGLDYRYDTQLEPLFEGVDFTLYSGDKVALMGANGAGKTTLLGLVAGRLPLQNGQLTRHDTPLYLQQEDTLKEASPTGDEQVLGAVLKTYPDLGPLFTEMSALEAQGVPDPLRYADLCSLFAERGGYDVEAALHTELGALGFEPDILARPLAELSGGQRRLVRLAAAFARPQTLLLFDEPTNYLDERATAYLTGKLQTSAAACLLVSHDRRFLDDTVSAVWELEHGSLRRFSGSYSSFRAQREAEYRERVRRSEKLKRDITQLKEQERTYKVWGARKEKEKSGAADRGFIGARAARLMRRGIQAKERLQDRIENLEDAKPWVEKRYQVAFEEVAVPSGVCLSARDVSILGHKVSVNVGYGEHLAVAGANGAGKTTLLRTLLGLGKAPTETAASLIWDNQARTGYLPQRWDDAHDHEPVAGRFSQADQPNARLLLGALGVSGALFSQPLGALSEGQKRKVGLAALILQRPNVLILDEPTTHLDYVSVEMLEAALEAFSGTLILVSHDRYLLERTTERRLEL